MLHKHAELLYQGVQEAVQGHLTAVGQAASVKADSEVCALKKVKAFRGRVWVGGSWSSPNTASISPPSIHPTPSPNTNLIIGGSTPSPSPDTTRPEQLLEELAGRWADHQVTMNMVRDILMYMVSTVRRPHFESKRG